jgi:hypothetical protein
MRYHRRLVATSELGSDGRLTATQRSESRSFPVTIINLLRKGSIDRDRSEAKLYSAFCDLITALHSECGMRIINLGLDWHELVASQGDLAPVVAILWGAAEQHYKGFGFSMGSFTDGEAGDGAGAPWGGSGMRALTSRMQQGIFRINCADSLDRTNVASYFSSLQVCTEAGLPKVARSGSTPDK